MIALLSAAALAVAVPHNEPEALLRVDLDGPVMLVAVRDSLASGRELAIDCIAKCTRPIRYREAVADVPLGVFQPFDAEPVVVSLWAGGSAYHVRAYRLAVDGVTRVLDTATRSAPTVGVDAAGAIAVTTTERQDDAGADAPLRTISWSWRGDRFVRAGAAPSRHR